MSHFGRDGFKSFASMFSGSGDRVGDRVVVVPSRWSELVKCRFPVNDLEDVFMDVDPVSKVLKPSATDFASVYFSRAGAVVQDIIGLTLAEYQATGYNGLDG